MFDKHYPNRKDWRRDYPQRARRMDASCRPGGDCPRCQADRQHAYRKRIESAKDREENL